MTSSVRAFVFCSVLLGIGDVFTQRFKFQRYNYDPWTGRTSSVEEFDEDIRNMDSRQLQKYMTELRRVKNGLEEMRRESEVLERDLGFELGGFPSLMDNSESIISHALESVTDQLQRRIGHQDPKLLQSQQRFDDKVKSADRPTLQRNLERLQQTKQQITEAKQRAEALKNELGFDFDQEAMKRAESAVDHGMNVINHRMQKLDHPQHPHASNTNVTNGTKQKVDQALQNADPQRLAKFDNEFKRMKQYMDDVKSQLDTFHRDIGFQFDGIFEPFAVAESVLDHGLSSIGRHLQGAFNQQNVAGGPQQGAGAQPGYQPNPAGGAQPNPAGGPQPNPAGGPQQNPAGGPQPTLAASQQQTQTTVQSG